MFEAFLNRLKESLEGLTAFFGGFTSVFMTFMQLAANKNNDDNDGEEETEAVKSKKR